ncbi:MAG: response regulator [Acidimicrobiales bacterium]
MSPAGTATTVVVVEDEPLLRAGLSGLLGAEGHLRVVGEAADGREAIAVIRETRPDVALLDIRMPLLDGIAVTRTVTAEAGGPRVLLLTTFASEESMMEGLSAGASGFLLKSASPEQVIAAIHAVAAGESVVAPSMTRSLIDRAVLRQGRVGDAQTGTTHFPDPPQPAAQARPLQALPGLSPRETEVLVLIAQGRSDKAIARTLGVALPTVKSHVHRVLYKLDVNSRVQAALAARDAGLVGPR